MPIDPIPGVYNYCHRWCERCLLTERCLVYADVRHYDGVAAGSSEPHPFAHIYSVPPTAEAEEFLRELETAQAAMTPDDHASSERELREVDERVAADPLTTIARDVSRALAAACRGGALLPGDPVLTEAWAVVGHYGLFIGAKVRRALHGLYTARTGSGLSDDDARGTAKVALLGLESLAPAVEVLALSAPENERLRSAVAELPVLRALMLERFPDAMSFLRPGFDDDLAAGGPTAITR